MTGDFDDYYLAYGALSDLPEQTGKTTGYMSPAFDPATGRMYKTDASALGNAFENTVVVKQASDLTNIDSTKNYMIDGVVDMGSTPIVVPTGGISISGLNGARDTAKLISTENNYTIVDLAESGRHTLNLGGRAEGVSIHGFTNLDTGDRIEIWVENYTAARNVTAQLDGNVSILER